MSGFVESESVVETLSGRKMRTDGSCRTRSWLSTRTTWHLCPCPSSAQRAGEAEEGTARSWTWSAGTTEALDGTTKRSRSLVYAGEQGRVYAVSGSLRAGGQVVKRQCRSGLRAGGERSVWSTEDLDDSSWPMQAEAVAWVGELWQLLSVLSA